MPNDVVACRGRRPDVGPVVLYLRGPIIDTYACLASGWETKAADGMLGSPLKGRPSHLHTYDTFKQNFDSLLLLLFPKCEKEDEAPTHAQRTYLCARMDSGHACVSGAGDVNQRGGSGAELGLASRIRGSESGQRGCHCAIQCKVDSDPPQRQGCGVVWGLSVKARAHIAVSFASFPTDFHITAPHRRKEGFLLHTASTVLATIPGVTFHYLRRSFRASCMWRSSDTTAVAQRNTHAPPFDWTEASRRREAQKSGGERRVATKESYFRLLDKDEDEDERAHYCTGLQGQNVKQRVTR
ncbi:hypothetical protein EDB92DRAFT_1815831 [Lactarius akahatsu]|uniref:Uncharacterized protein n=1 Tax=Lactarius akahatsu TaxID=416441 RepID=A0AAD4QE52_9AGAM|nr:hypothetical protein EDB92DRAFT_1815831 [Lactarius akahatsu]